MRVNPVVGWGLVGQVSPTARQLGPGLGLTVPPPAMLVPVHVPDRGLAAGVLKKDVGTAGAVPIACQLGPGLALTVRRPSKLVPFISQIATWPLLVF